MVTTYLMVAGLCLIGLTIRTSYELLKTTITFCDPGPG